MFLLEICNHTCPNTSLRETQFSSTISCLEPGMAMESTCQRHQVNRGKLKIRRVDWLMCEILSIRGLFMGPFIVYSWFMKILNTHEVGVGSPGLSSGSWFGEAETSKNSFYFICVVIKLSGTLQGHSKTRFSKIISIRFYFFVQMYI